MVCTSQLCKIQKLIHGVGFDSSWPDEVNKNISVDSVPRRI